MTKDSINVSQNRAIPELKFADFSGANPAMAATLRSVSQLAHALSGQIPMQTFVEQLQKLTLSTTMAFFRYYKDSGDIKLIASAPVDLIVRAKPELVNACSSGCLATIEHGRIFQFEDLDGVSIMALLLAQTAQKIDLIQMELPQGHNALDGALVQAFVTSAVDIWQKRQPGIIAATIAERGRTRVSVPETKNCGILDISNPFELSRSEFRVCTMLGRGLKPQAIADELGLSIATIRSHLRGIYAKTEAEGMMDVIFRLKNEA